MKLETIKFKDGTSKLLEIFKQAANVLIARDQQGLWYIVSRQYLKEETKKESKEDTDDNEQI